ncbi:restriction endonuclease subunit S [Lactobacillus delbrueckii subsp. bulgaricus]
MKFEDFIELHRGYDLPKKQRKNGQVPVIASTGINGTHNVAKIKGPGVVTGRSGSIGKVQYIKDDFWPLNTTLYVSDFKGNNPKFVAYWLERFDLKRFSSGSAVPTLNRNELANVEICVPNREEQDKIVAILEPFEKKIELNQEINDNLLEISRQNYLKILSSKIAQHGRLSDLAEVTMGQSPKSDTYNFECNGLPLLNGAADFRGSISPSKWTSDPKRIAHKGEYIFGVRATVGLTRKIFRDYAIGRGTGAARARKEEFDEFLYFTLEELFNYYTHVGSGSVYVNISKNEFEEFKCMIPNQSSMSSFHLQNKPIFNLISKNEMENFSLSSIRQELLFKYF